MEERVKHLKSEKRKKKNCATHICHSRVPAPMPFLHGLENFYFQIHFDFIPDLELMSDARQCVHLWKLPYINVSQIFFLGDHCSDKTPLLYSI